MYYFSLIGEYLRMAWHALKAHKMRSILTTLGIFIGVTTIITIFTTIQGLNEYVTGQLSTIGSSTVYVEKYPWVIQGDFWKYRNRKNITKDEYEALLEYSEEADYISPQIFSMKVVQYKDEKYDRIFIMGTSEQYKDTDNISPGEGRFITELDVKRKHAICVIGAELAENLFKNEDPLGKRIYIGDRKYKVVGVLEKRGKVFGQSMDNYAIVPIGTFQRAFGTHRGYRVAMTVQDVSRLEDMKDEIRGIMRRVRKIEPQAEDDFAINQQDQLTELYKQLTGVLYLIVFVIGSMSLVVGGIGIMNIMLVSVTERTKEIGIRKAIGAKRKNILSQFLIESISISSVGGILGIILGFAGGAFVLSMMELSISVSLVSIIVGFGFSTMVGISAGFYPAWKAAKMNPIDSLHYE
jgi:putative ABC transport system permease protein